MRPVILKELWARLQLRSTTHLLDESFATITGDQRRDNFLRDIGWLRDEGIVVGVVFHGSDIRSPASHLDREPDSFFRIMESRLVAQMEASTARRRRQARETGLPLFVSTPDLLSDLPEATWLPLVADLSAWQATRPAFSGRRVRVLHVPSRRVPPIKGTSFIDPVLSRLASEGLVEYVNPERVSHARMPDLVRSVDVVIDQLLTGSYGVAAVEAMAAARLVVGHVGAGVRAVAGRPIPIVDCTPSGLADLIRDVAEEPASFAAIAQAGPSFVADLHSGSRSAQILGVWLSATRG